MIISVLMLPVVKTKFTYTWQTIAGMTVLTLDPKHHDELIAAKSQRFNHPVFGKTSTS